jgi:hypothetical protein
MPGRMIKKNRGKMVKLKRGGKSSMKANKIDLSKPVTVGDILFKKTFGMGKGKAKGGGAATKGLDYNICPSGKE